MGFLLILVMLIGVAASGAWAAFVTFRLYAWFVVPLGAPPLNWWHIWGLLMVLGAILTPYIYKDPDREDTATQAVKFFTRIITIGLALAISLLLGWIVKGQI